MSGFRVGDIVINGELEGTIQRIYRRGHSETTYADVEWQDGTIEQNFDLGAYGERMKHVVEDN